MGKVILFFLNAKKNLRYFFANDRNDVINGVYAIKKVKNSSERLECLMC